LFCEPLPKSQRFLILQTVFTVFLQSRGSIFGRETCGGVNL